MPHVTVPDAVADVSYVVVASSAGPFAIPFVFTAKEDVKVAINGVLLDASLWTLGGTPITGGYQTGTCTLTTAVSNSTVRIYRDIPASRTTDFASGPLPKDALNTALDRLTMHVQDLELQLQRAVRVRDGEVYAPVLDGKTAGALKFFATDANGNPILSNGVATTPVSSAMGAVVASPTTDEAAARLNAALEVDNIAALRAKAWAGAARADFVVTRGQWTAADGPGFFRLDAADGVSVDDGHSVVVDGGSNRYKRVRASDTYFLRDFGAIGTGAATDAATLLAAINTAKADGRMLDCHGRLLQIPAAGLRAVLAAGQTLRIRDLRLDLSIVATSQTLSSSWSSKFGIGLVAEQSAGVDMWAGGYTTTTLTAIANRGDVTLTVAELSSFTVGDEIIIRDATKVWDADGSICSEGATVIGKSAVSGAGTLTLAGNLRSSYTTSATVRRWISADVDIDGMELIGGGVGADQDGLWIWGMRGARIRNAVVTALENRGLVVSNCRRAFIDDVVATRCAKNGLGYGLVTNGSDRVLVTNLDGSNCRHLFASGKGAGGSTMQTSIELSNVVADGMQDAAVDAHPGVYAMTVSNLLARGAANAGTSGDGLILFQGTHLSVTNARQVGPTRRHGITVEQYGHLDETGGSRFQFTNCVTEPSTQALVNYGLVFSDAPCIAANGFTGNTTSNTALIETTTCDFRSRSGTSILVSTNTVNEVRLIGGSHRSVGPSNHGHGFLASCPTTGAIQRVASAGTTFESNGGSGFAGMFLQGRAGALISGHVTAGASRGSNQWGFRVDQGTLTHAPVDATGFTTSATVAGTGGTLVPY